MTTATGLAPVLSDEEVDRFWTDGYLLLRGVLSREEAAHYAQHILSLVPRDLSIPEHWHAAGGRIKPIYTPGNHTFDTPDLIPLFQNERLYATMAQLLESTRLRVMDGSLGITMRNDANREAALSQTLHLDASVPRDADNFLFTLDEVQLGGCFYFTDVEPEGGGIHVVPGGHRIVEEECRNEPKGRQLHEGWKRITHLESVEVTGSAGDFALLHHLMPHGASHNRRPQPRVAQFLRWVREDQPHGAGKRPPAGKYNELQIAAMSPLGRRLFGVDAWD
ncbi:MAG TPA: phytanoyl-CoA dioxygenase family protein [Mycobacteriales bacterium]|nr:phytanoyl-CoA dioxygenase family protein [Mycobacteriales bacterium]